ncbi:hypothetical protein AAG906_002218 [Vitis piasezkii]
MLSLNAPTSLSLSHHHLLHRRHHHHRLKTHVKPISATIIPSSSTPPHSQQPQLYQPFRPPSPNAPIPSHFRSLDTGSRLEVLSNRLGLWFEYAPLVSTLMQEGFTPSSLEEATGISGVEQNRLVVAAQVRHSLLESSLDPQILSFFDNGGDSLLYEIRLLSARERLAAARYVVENRVDPRGAQELARAIKDFPRRRGDRGWECFDYNVPGDCLAFMYYRQSREHRNSLDKRRAALEKALEVAETEKAKRVLLEELERNDDADDGKSEIEGAVRVPVVRMKTGEVAEATTVVVLPVCEAQEGVDVVLGAPLECRSQGEFGVVVAEKGWKRWVVLPGWEPVAGLRAGVVVAFGDARALPWRVNRWYKEEAILVVANRGAKEVVADAGFYLVAVSSDNGSAGGELKVERGSALKERGVKESLGTVVLVVRPPREETDHELRDEDWE